MKHVARDLPTIDMAKELQDKLGLRDTHLVWIGETGFTIAHTDAERATGEPLEDCELHQTLATYWDPPHPNRIGWHTFWYDQGAGIWRNPRV